MIYVASQQRGTTLGRSLDTGHEKETKHGCRHL
jgi:hypothetical protein